MPLMMQLLNARTRCFRGRIRFKPLMGWSEEFCSLRYRRNFSETTNDNVPPTTFARLAEISRPEWPLLAKSVGTLSVTSSIVLIFPYAAGHVIDAAGSGQGDPLVMAGGLFGLVCMSGGGVYLRAKWLAEAGNRLVARLRQQTYSQLLVQEQDYFRSGTGDLLSRLSTDAQLIQTALTVHVVSALRGFVVSAGSTGMLLTMSPTLTALSLATLPPIFILSRSMGRSLQKDQKEVQAVLGDAANLAEQALGGLATVKQYVAEEYEASRYRTSIANAHTKAIETAKRQAQLEGLTYVGANGAVLAVLGYGGTMVLQGSLSPGDLTSFVLYSFLLAGNLSSLTSLYADMIRAMAASERVLEILDRQPVIPPPARISPPEDDSLKVIEWVEHYVKNEGHPSTAKSVNPASISIENVSFAYSSRPEVAVLKKMNLEVLPGQVIALVGSSGCGKSTVGKLLTRLHDINEGRILINGVDVSTIAIEELRSQIAVVSQEPVLFKGTIRANIRYGNWKATDTEIERVAKLANVLEFSDHLPQGLETQVTSTTLSGGQRQRVAIARALVKDAPIVILDEATASLDAQSEYHVQQAMNEIFRQQKTVVSIAHRLSTIRHADTIAVLDAGRIVQQGAFKELAEQRKGEFWKLMQTQLVSG